MRTKRHNEHCRDCKESFKNLLIATFGMVEVNYDINLPSKLEDYADSSIYSTLEMIYQAIGRYRGFDKFVKAKNLPRVDFFIPEKNIIVEFDESQHFTKPRGIALGLYPNEKKYGYSTQRWCDLCQNLNKKDNDPPYRDEQRAWYDTLRDFAPYVWGNGATIRLYSRDLVWCSLDPAADVDVKIFKDLLLKDNEIKI